MTINIHGVDLDAYSDLHKDAYGFRPRKPADSITKEEFDRVCEASDAVISELPAQRKEWIAYASKHMGRTVTYEELCDIVETNKPELDKALDVLISYPG